MPSRGVPQAGVHLLHSVQFALLPAAGSSNASSWAAAAALQAWRPCRAALQLHLAFRKQLYLARTRAHELDLEAAAGGHAQRL